MTELTSKQKSLVELMLKSPMHMRQGFTLIQQSTRPEDFFEQLSSQGFFDRERNPRTEHGDREGFYRVPYWPALDYLKLIAQLAGQRGDITLGNRLMDIVRNVSSPADNYKPEDNYFTHAAFAEVMGLIPPSCINVGDIAYIQTWLNTRWDNSLLVPELDKSLFPSLLKEASATHDPKKVVALLEATTILRPDAASSPRARSDASVADAYWLEQLLEHHSREIGTITKRPGVECLVGRVRALFSDPTISRNSWLNRPAIEDHDQNHSWDSATNSLVDALRDSLDAWLGAAPDEAAAYVIALLDDPDEIIRRIAIHTSRNRWDLLGKAFQEKISPKLFSIGHLHEMYKLLCEYYSSFSEDAREATRSALAALTNDSAGPDETERRQSIQRNWLDAIRDRGDAEADKEYRRLSEILGPIREHPDFLSYSTFTVGTGPSPYSKEEIKAFARENLLIDKVDGFVPPEDERRSSRKSLIDTVGTATSESPKTFLPYLESTQAMSRRLQYGILSGFQQYIASIKEGDEGRTPRLVLNSLLPYTANLMADAAFWEEPVTDKQGWEPTRDWIPAVATSTVKQVASNDVVALTPEDCAALLAIATNVMERSTGLESTEDPMTASINNTRGEAFEAILQVLLRMCREDDKAKGNHVDAWDRIRPYVEAELERPRVGLEVSTLLGAYIAQLLYVDEAWTISRLPNIFDPACSDNFVCAVAGLSYTSTSGKVYKALLTADTPLQGIRHSALKGSARERLVERISLAYMWGLEDLDGPTVQSFFSQEHLDDLIEMATTIARWSDNAELESHQLERAKRFAERCVNIQGLDKERRRRLFAALSGFIDYARPPTEADMAWLLQVAGFAHDSHHQYQFSASVDRLASVDAGKAARVLAAFLEHRQPNYDYKNSLESAIKKIHGAGLHAQALELTNILVTKGGLSSMLDLYQTLGNSAE